MGSSSAYVAVCGTDGKCGARKTSGDGRCQLPAGYGTDHLGWGSCKFHFGSTAHGNMAGMRQAAAAFADKLGGEIDLSPEEAILWAVRLSAGAVEYWRQQIEQLDPEHDLALLELAEKTYGEERDRLAKTAAMTLRAGVEERQVRIAERQGALLAEVLEATLAHLGLSQDQIDDARQFAQRKVLALPGADAA